MRLSGSSFKEIIVDDFMMPPKRSKSPLTAIDKQSLGEILKFDMPTHSLNQFLAKTVLSATTLAPIKLASSFIILSSFSS